MSKPRGTRRISQGHGDFRARRSGGGDVRYHQGPDEFPGERCPIGQPTRLANAATITDCVLMRVA